MKQSFLSASVLSETFMNISLQNHWCSWESNCINSSKNEVVLANVILACTRQCNLKINVLKNYSVITLSWVQFGLKSYACVVFFFFLNWTALFQFWKYGKISDKFSIVVIVFLSRNHISLNLCNSNISNGLQQLDGFKWITVYSRVCVIQGLWQGSLVCRTIRSIPKNGQNPVQ